MTPELEIMATSSTNDEVTNDLGVATNSCTVPLGDQEAMMKAMARSHRIGRLAKHHHAYIATTTSTVAPCHTMPRRGHKTMMTTMPGYAQHDSVTCKPSYLGSLSRAHDPSVGRTFIFVYDLAPDSNT